MRVNEQVHTDGVTAAGDLCVPHTEVAMPLGLVILDLDETLVHAAEEPLAEREDLRVGKYHVYFRPYLRDFISFCFGHFEVGIWTSSSRDYAEPIVDRMIDGMAPVFFWDRARCTRRYDSESGSYYWIKNLKKLKRRGYSLDEVVLVDDTSRKVERQYGNHIRVTEWCGQQDDQELRLLPRFLTKLSTVPNVRAVEKRGWQIQVAEQAD